MSKKSTIKNQKFDVHFKLMKYLEPLPVGKSLQVFLDEKMIFESEGKWLHPLFDLEEFLKNSKQKSLDDEQVSNGEQIVDCAEVSSSAALAVDGAKTLSQSEKNFSNKKNILCSHDSAIGKAAAALTIRLGIKKINADLVSQNALTFIEEFNKSIDDESEKIQITYKNLVPKLMCATENQLENIFDIDEIYFLLRQRAKLVQGVDVKVEKLNYKYGAIKDLSFELKCGGGLMILGENGIGKSTLLKLLAGILEPTSGTILIDGKNVKELEKFTIGYIPQFTDDTNFSLSVEEVVSLGISEKTLANKNLNVKDKSELIKKSLIRTSSLHLLKRSFSSLSGGEKQKVNLSRCLAQNAKLLLLDEPTASLDAENRKMVIDILRSLSISEIPTIIVVTHDKELFELSHWEKIRLGE